MTLRELAEELNLSFQTEQDDEKLGNSPIFIDFIGHKHRVKSVWWDHTDNPPTLYIET